MVRRLRSQKDIRLPSLLLSILALGIAACTAISNRPNESPPNILLIVSEDNGPELGAYGDPYARTPVLDGLAREGVLFRNAYVPQAGCSQSRAAFLTGLYPHQNGQIGLATWKFGLYREDTPNIVRSLKAAGYRAGIIGKLHVNPKDAFPFDFVAQSSANFQRKDLGTYARSASAFFEESSGPFFLSVNYPDAHRPFLRQVDGLPAEPLTESDVDALQYMGLDSPTLRRDTADYYNSLSRLDALVGDLLDALDQSGRAGNTLVVYLGDHGADLLRGKRTCYEGGVRVPLIVRWPDGQQAGQVREELVSTLDLAPTILSAARTDLIHGLEGLSLEPLLSGDAAEWREHLFTEYHLHSNHNYFPQRSVRDKRYKLIWNLMPGQENPGYAFTVDKFIGDGEMANAVSEADPTVRDAYERMAAPPEFELYDLERDPYEFSNLADSPAHQEILADLRTRLLNWRKRTDDPFLDSSSVERLKMEVESTFKDGNYTRPDGWQYRAYLAPTTPAWLKGGSQPSSR